MMKPNKAFVMFYIMAVAAVTTTQLLFLQGADAKQTLRGSDGSNSKYAVNEAMKIAAGALKVSFDTKGPVRLMAVFDRKLNPQIVADWAATPLGIGGSLLQQTEAKQTVWRHLGMGLVEMPNGTNLQTVTAAAVAMQDYQGVTAVYPDSVLRIPDDKRGNRGQSGVNNQTNSTVVTGQENDSMVPNDPLYKELWGMDAIDADEAWHIHTGQNATRRTKVMVIDTGVDWNHEDLAENMWKNQAEIDGEAGVDDDGNGFVDDFYGWNAIEWNGFPEDRAGHGTHCAGTIGAVGNNAAGVVGVNWNPEIIACKFLGDDGYGYTSDAISCLEFSVAVGADLSSNSWGGEEFDPALSFAIEAVGSFNQIFVSAAGNLGRNLDDLPSYPCSNDPDNIVCVAALTESGQDLAYFSNYGAIAVDIAAPGEYILSTLPGDSYNFYSGTSMAAPHISGLLALMKSMNPSLSVAEMIDVLKGSAVPFPDSKRRLKWAGKINARMAMELSLPVIRTERPMLNPSTMTCRNSCSQVGFTCLEEETLAVNTDLELCTTKLRAFLPSKTFFLGSEVNPLAALQPTGCFVSFRASTYRVDLNLNDFGTTLRGCDAPPAVVSSTDRLCICQEVAPLSPTGW